MTLVVCSCVPALVSCALSLLISTMALYLSPLSSQNFGVQPENSQAPTAPTVEHAEKKIANANILK